MPTEDTELRENIIEAEVIDEAERPRSQELAPRQRTREVLRPLNPAELLASMDEYQDLLQSLLTDEDWQGTPNRPGSFVKKQGWRKIATAFDLDVELLRSEVSRDEEGLPLRAEVWARATAPSGRRMDGDGYCDRGEKRFATSKGREKLENDLRATAATRAMNRAISGLVGLGAVSAEEVDSTPREEDGRFTYGPKATDRQIAQTRAAIKYMIASPDEGEIDDILELVQKAAQTEQMRYLPLIACRAICFTATVFKERNERGAVPHADDPAGETSEEREQRERAEEIARGEGVLRGMAD